MSNRYAVGSGTNWSSTASWSATSGGASGVSVPTAADDVIFDIHSPGTITISAAAVCRSLDCSAFTHTLVHGAFNLTIGTSTVNGTLALKLGTSMTYTLSSVTSSAIIFASTSTTQIQITAAGKTLGNVTFSGAAGSWLLVDGFTNGATATVTHTAGTLNTNGQACSWGKLASTGTTTRALTLGASAIAITAITATQWNVTSTGLTFSAGTSTITLSGAAVTFTGGAQTYYNVAFTGSGAVNIGGINTFGALTRTGTAVLTDSVIFSAAQTITGTLTLGGNSQSNRLLVTSSTLGTAVIVTAASPTLTNCDFQDIYASSTWTGTSLGDAGGNTSITFTTAVTRYAVLAGNYSSTTMWSTTSGGSSGASMPLPQDTAVFDSSSPAGTYALNMARTSGITCTGFTRTLSGSTSFYGSVVLSSGMTNSLSTVTLAGRGSQTVTLAGASKLGANVTVNPRTGTWTFSDAFVCTGSLTHTSGTLTASASVTATGFASTGSATRTVNMGTGTWTVSGTGSPWNVTASGMTLNPGTSTIAVTNDTAHNITFAGGGLTYATVVIGPNLVAITAGAGYVTYYVTITGSNTFDTLTLEAPNSYLFANTTTQTITTAFNASGTVDDENMLGSDAPGVAWNLSKATGTVNVDFVVMTDCSASGGAAFVLGGNSGSSVPGSAYYNSNVGWTVSEPQIVRPNGPWTLQGVGHETTLTVGAMSVGDLMIAVYTNDLSGGSLTVEPTISGGGVTTWNRVYHATGNLGYMAVWWGIATSTAAPNLVFTYTGHTGNNISLLADTFTTGAPQGWTAESSGSTGVAHGGSNPNCLFPSLTPESEPDLYWSYIVTEYGMLTILTNPSFVQSFIGGSGSSPYVNANPNCGAGANYAPSAAADDPTGAYDAVAIMFSSSAAPYTLLVAA